MAPKQMQHMRLNCQGVATFMGGRSFGGLGTNRPTLDRLLGLLSVLEILPSFSLLAEFNKN